MDTEQVNKHTTQTIDMENGCMLEVRQDGKIEVFEEKETNGPEGTVTRTILETNVNEWNRINRILYAGRKASPRPPFHKLKNNFNKGR